jgi:hypothetical protein
MTWKLFGHSARADNAWWRLSGVLVAATASLALSMPARSATVSYVLDQSNVLADGVDYMKVTLSDSDNGSIHFKVEMLDSLLSMGGDSHFGIDSFAFNVVGGTDTEAQDVSGLPGGWVARNQRRMDGFGLFDIRVKGSGRKRTNELEFDITGVDLDTLMSYADLSTGRAPQGHVFFAAHIGGLAIDKCNVRESSSVHVLHNGGSGGHDDDGECSESAYIGGPGTIVPMPAAVWLFGSGIGLLGAVRRRVMQN